ncbi:DNA primase [Thiosulfatimonas sediminis]|uniref:DNA primase n=1 Tax=Thiosulfatimonas sediminis TaxID=2675054 RepID=A0A6F8PW55_9GAMM|nr:zincin-like metallopeptidase domain-containing protein [Thiosulfatimonas sediminis]BBP46326.1 DNA primase [Thiosulfatimonas sediminis]
MAFKKVKDKDAQFKKVTQQIVESLEKGLVDGSFSVPWDRMRSIATNAKTGQRLIGISQLLCSMSMAEQGFEANRWLTFKQATELGGKVIKGSKSTLVFWLRPFLKDSKGKLFSPDRERIQQAMEDGEDVIWSYRYAPYFNVEQIEGLEEHYYDPKGSVVEPLGVGEEFSPIEVAEQYLSALSLHAKDPVELSHGGVRAFYSPLSDSITLPKKEKFHSELAYYQTRLHETIHWTGAASRCNRDGIVKFDAFGSTQYAFEELVAQLGAAMASAELGLESGGVDDMHVKYIKSWVKVLKDDYKAIFKASQEAMKSVRLLNRMVVEAQSQSIDKVADDLAEQASL